MTIPVVATLPATARELAREVIVSNVPELGERVYEVGSAASPDLTDGLPFCLLSFGSDPVANVWGARSILMTITVEVPKSYSEASYIVVDQLNSKIIGAFAQHRVLDEVAALGMTDSTLMPGVLGTRYIVDFAGYILQDSEDQSYDALIHPIQFTLAALNERQELAHPVLAAFRHWALEQWPSVQVDSSLFNPTSLNPSIAFRFERGEMLDEALTDEIRWVDALISVHVIAPDEMDRVRWAYTISSALRSRNTGVILAMPTSMSPEVYADTLNDSPKLAVNVTRHDPNADTFTIGQLTVHARWLEVDPDLLEVAPKLTAVFLSEPMAASVSNE